MQTQLYVRSASFLVIAFAIHVVVNKWVLKPALKTINKPLESRIEYPIVMALVPIILARLPIFGTRKLAEGAMNPLLSSMLLLGLAFGTTEAVTQIANGGGKVGSWLKDDDKKIGQIEMGPIKVRKDFFIVVVLTLLFELSAQMYATRSISKQEANKITAAVEKALKNKKI
tara:strand:+ start:5591 stop:6103 length:513 start_codon:yes stop_codon:yes gene_type:complete